MKISVDEVKRVADAAKLAITEEEAGFYQGQLGLVSDWFAQLKDVDTSAVSRPAAQCVPLREDCAFLNPASGEIKDAFNDKQGNLLKVKKVL